jgi:hypothetical protein
MCCMRALRNKDRDLHFGHSTSRIRDLFVSVITPTEPLGENPGTSQFVRISRNARCCRGVYQEKSYQPYRRRSRLYQQNQQGGCSRSLGLPRPALAKARLRFDDKPVGEFQSGGPRRFSSAGGADETLHLASCSRVRRGKLHMPQCDQRKPYIHRCGQRSTVRSKLCQPNVQI